MATLPGAYWTIASFAKEYDLNDRGMYIPDADTARRMLGMPSGRQGTKLTEEDRAAGFVEWGHLTGFTNKDAAKVAVWMERSLDSERKDCKRDNKKEDRGVDK
ncbi:hypothetical protein LCGC14_1496860 [marine sediment metagenome]|uniref:Uncharacterized protein n=1 Tax=marine sediment metagenome TaxID=412755 RepID=A0A0F9LKT5_9ZZZZ